MDLMKNYEKQLAQRVSKGDRNAFREIVEDNKKKIFHLAYDLTGSAPDAEDLSQEVFIRAYKGMGSFTGEASLSTWLHRITINLFIDGRRKKETKWEKVKFSLDEKTDETTIEDDAPLWSDPVIYTESLQIQSRIRAALEHLSPRERSVFIMRRYEGLPGKTVGKILDISEGTVKALLFRAVKKLQEKLSVYRVTPGREATP